jgi:CheY-like chemotaxis protein
MFRNSDLRIVYSNQLAKDTFGITDYETQEINVWELLDPRAVGVGVVTKIVDRDGQKVEEMSEGFVNFVRYKTNHRFTGWMRLSDVIEQDGSVKYRSIIIFADYDANEDDKHWNEFMMIKRSVAERDLSGLFAHKLNNSVALLENAVEELSANSNLEVKAKLNEPIERIKRIGFEAKTFAESVPNLPNNPYQQPALQPSTKKSDTNTKTTKVLVIDDEAELAEGLCLLFRNHNIEAVWATSKSQAILLAQSFKPDSALIDIILGNDDGFDTSEALKSLLPDLKVLMMTGYSGVVSKLNAQNLKVVAKPFNIADVAQYLKDEN